MPPQRIDLLNPAFGKSFRGYNREEVDGFLREVADILARQREEKLRLSRRVSELETRLRQLEERESNLGEAVSSAMKLIDESRRNAQREAQLVLETARNKAESIVRQAGSRLSALLDDIDEAGRMKKQIRAQLRIILEGHLSMLDKPAPGEEKEEQALKTDSRLRNMSGRQG